MLLFFIHWRIKHQYVALKNTQYNGRRQVVWAAGYPVGLYLFRSDKNMHTHMSAKSTLTH